MKDEKVIQSGADFVAHQCEMISSAESFWNEISRRQVLLSIELGFRREIIRDMCITNIATDPTNGFVIKWEKRFRPLTDEEMEETYGK